jgi:hypothetical protein
MQVTEIESSSTELWTAGSPAARPTAPNELAVVL